MGRKKWLNENTLNELKNEIKNLSAKSVQESKKVEREYFMHVNPNCTMYCCKNWKDLSVEEEKKLIKSLLQKYHMNSVPTYFVEESCFGRFDLSADIYFLGYNKSNKPCWIIAGDTSWGTLVTAEKLESIVRLLAMAC